MDEPPGAQSWQRDTILFCFFFCQAENKYNYLSNQTGSRRKGPNGQLDSAA